MDTVHVYKDSSGEWRWRRVSENGREVGASSEGYQNKRDCLSNVDDTQGGQEFEVVEG